MLYYFSSDSRCGLWEEGVFFQWISVVVLQVSDTILINQYSSNTSLMMHIHRCTPKESMGWFAGLLKLSRLSRAAINFGAGQLG
jgi:hypothetical protein